MSPSEVKSGMEVTYKKLKAFVVTPFLNFVVIEMSDGEQNRIKVNYSQIEKYEQEQINKKQ
jgi:hypothetical protein